MIGIYDEGGVHVMTSEEYEAEHQAMYTDENNAEEQFYCGQCRSYVPLSQFVGHTHVEE